MTMFSKVSILLLLLVMVTAITAIRNDDFENLRDQRAKKLLGRFDRLRYKNLRYQRVNDDQDRSCANHGVFCSNVPCPAGYIECSFSCSISWLHCCCRSGK